jgi:hypothetical protein
MQTVIDGHLLSEDQKPEAYGAICALSESIKRWKKFTRIENIHDSSLLVACLEMPVDLWWSRSGCRTQSGCAKHSQVALECPRTGITGMFHDANVC